MLLSRVEISWYREATLLRAADDIKVYVIEGSAKRWIQTQKAFIGGGYDWNDVVEVASIVVESYATGASIGEGQMYTVSIKADGFHPSTITIQRGDTIRFVNNDTQPRWPASNVHPKHEDYPEFDPLTTIGPEESWIFTFARAGEWGMHDHIDPTLAGSIIVAE